MTKLTYSARVWGLVADELPETEERLQEGIALDVDQAESWNTMISVCLSDKQAELIKKIIEEEGINPEA